MADNNKLFVDISINGNSKQQVDKYIRSFDSLRNSIIGLSQPINSIYNSLNIFEKILVVIAFLSEIINFAEALFTGKDALSAMAANLKT